MQAARDAITSGALGHVFAAELEFHNAYGPDKAWFRDLRAAGGGALMDLGTHLVDLALWSLGRPLLRDLEARFYAGGRQLRLPLTEVEDYAVLELELEGDIRARLSCSWNLHAGCEAVIGARFWGTAGGCVLRNVGGSYYDFVVERTSGTAAETLGAAPDAWGGRSLQAWVCRLAAGGGFDEAEDPALVPFILDLAYGRETAP